MADYYPVLARAVSNLAHNDVQARRELYARARMIVAEQLRRQYPQDTAQDAAQDAAQGPASATMREQAALETAIRRVEAELRPVRTRAPERRAPSPPPRRRAAVANVKAPPQSTANSLTKILQALQAEEPRRGGLETSDRMPMDRSNALVPRAPKPNDATADRTSDRSEELDGAPNSLGTMLFGIAYIMTGVAFAGVTYIRCLVWVAQGVIGYPTLFIVMAIALGLFIAPPLVILRRTSAAPSSSSWLRFLYSSSRRVF